MASSYTFAGRRARVDADKLTDADGEFWLLSVYRGALKSLVRMPADDERAVHRRALREAWGEQA